MSSVIDIFNTRELAILIWGAIIVLGLLSYSKTRQAVVTSVPQLIKYLFARAITISLAVMGLYILAVVKFLQEVGFWEPQHLKDTLIWAFFVAIVSLFQIAKVSPNTNYFKDAIKNNLKLIIILEFIISFHTFSLLAELIIVPIASMLTILLASAELKKEHEILVGPLSGIMALLGLGIFALSFYKTVSDFETFATYETLIGFLLPLVLSTFLLPLLFLPLTYMAYENSSFKMSFSVRDPDLRKYAKWQAIFNFRFNRSNLARWINRLHFTTIESKADIRKSITDFKAQLKSQKFPKDVPISQGWSPHLAAEFLAEEGLKTGHYDWHGADFWSAQSAPFKIDNEALPSNITYHIEGNQDAVTVLKLRLEMSYEKAKEEAHEAFQLASIKLIQKSLRMEIPDALSNALMNAEEVSLDIEGKQVSVEKEDWPNRMFGPYDLTLKIECPSAG